MFHQYDTFAYVINCYLNEQLLLVGYLYAEHILNSPVPNLPQKLRYQIFPYQMFWEPKIRPRYDQMHHSAQWITYTATDWASDGRYIGTNF